MKKKKDVEKKTVWKCRNENLRFFPNGCHLFNKKTCKCDHDNKRCDVEEYLLIKKN